MTLELGGKNPIVVFPDADLDGAVPAAVTGMNFTATAGQSCASLSRAFVHRSVHDEFVERYLALTSQIKMGFLWMRTPRWAPRFRRASMTRSSATCRLRRTKAPSWSRAAAVPTTLRWSGHYVVPTMFDEVRPEMRIAQEEVFGPIVSVIPFDDESDVARAMNDVDYGLSASIWTNDLSRGLRLSREVESGIVWVNGQ